jgi:hypothetical protein
MRAQASDPAVRPQEHATSCSATKTSRASALDTNRIYRLFPERAGFSMIQRYVSDLRQRLSGEFGSRAYHWL